MWRICRRNVTWQRTLQYATIVHTHEARRLVFTTSCSFKNLFIRLWYTPRMWQAGLFADHRRKNRLQVWQLIGLLEVDLSVFFILQQSDTNSHPWPEKNLAISVRIASDFCRYFQEMFEAHHLTSPIFFSHICIYPFLNIGLLPG